MRPIRWLRRLVPRQVRRRASPALVAGVAVDAAVLKVMKGPGRYPAEAELVRVGEELRAAHELYLLRGVLEHPGCLHRTPPPLETPELSGARLRTLRFKHLTFPSLYEPAPDDPGRDRWLGYEANRTAAAWLVRHPGPDRPWLVCLHGLGTGSPAMDMPGFRAAHLHNKLGVNLLFPELPLHGTRRQPGHGRGDFLSYELLDVLHGVTQAVWDTRRLIAWLRANGAGTIGLYGMSLGAHVAGQVAAVEEDIDMVVAGIPIADVPELFSGHATPKLREEAEHFGLLGPESRALLHAASPLALPTLVPHERRYLYAGVGDRMATPAQARMLRDHWERPTTMWYPGGHVSFVWSRKVSGFVRRAVSDTLVA